MGVHIQWFGVLSLLTTSLAGAAAVGMALAAIIRLRFHDGTATGLLIAAAVLELAAICCGFFTTVAAALVGSRFADPAMVVATISSAWHVLRPLLHGAALVCIGIAVVRVAARIEEYAFRE